MKIAVIGYCFGGLCALDLARINAPNLVAAVSFHGVFTPLPDQPKPEEEAQIRASVLICHGDVDSHIPAEQVLFWGKLDNSVPRAILWAIAREGSNQFRKVICLSKALFVL